MALQDEIYHLRSKARLSRERFAEIMGVSHQSVSKWESGASSPDIRNLVKMAKLFGVSMDTLLLGGDRRTSEIIREITPNYATMDQGLEYAGQLETEYMQCMEEGLDIEQYHALFDAIGNLPAGVYKDKMADVLFSMVLNAPVREGYPYVEPSALDEIRSLRDGYAVTGNVPERDVLLDKIHGAWLGRACGCLLGKPVEGIRTNEFYPMLQEMGNWPLHRYILSTDIKPDMYDRYTFWLRGRAWADTVDAMPVDDDTNYTVLYQELIEKSGRDFSPGDVCRMWLRSQPREQYFTAEKVAYNNYVKGFEPPYSGSYKNPFREYIGAQIRGDYFGYINPGDPETAADMAFRDACISHVKNGIYVEMYVSAMIACAAVTDNMEQIIRGGMGQIPKISRLYEAVSGVLDDYLRGVSQKACFRKIHATYNEHTGYGWCHTISNAMIVTASLLYGCGDFGKSICMAVEAGFDTDCNGATVGSVLGMRGGTGCIGPEWSGPVNDSIITSIYGVGRVRISERAEMTMKHLK